RLLAKQPEQRYQSAVGLLADLRRAEQLWTTDGDVPEFGLGAADRALIPDTLFGRSAELAVLHEALAGAVAGRGGLVLLPGPPGVGKTVLVDELLPAVSAAGGWFVQRKYDQYARGFVAPGMLLSQLARLILREPPDRVEEVRRSLVEAVG